MAEEAHPSPSLNTHCLGLFIKPIYTDVYCAYSAASLRTTLFCRNITVHQNVLLFGWRKYFIIPSVIGKTVLGYHSIINDITEHRPLVVTCRVSI